MRFEREGGTVALGVVMLTLASCGGGGGTDAVCADFQYQEDAQAAYRGGASQLDRDNDGIACETLPNRPVGGDGSGEDTVLPSYNLLLGQGSLAVLRPAFGAYSLTFGSSAGGGGSATGPLAPVPVGGGQQVTSSLLTVRFATTTDGTLVSWTPASDGLPAASGIGIAASDAASLAELAGNYKLLGQHCTSNGSSCRVTTATVRITSAGQFEYCPDTEFSISCTGRDVRPMTAWTGSLGIVANVWSLDSSGNYLVGSRTRGTLAFTYENRTLDANFDRVTTDLFTYFGQREEVTVRDSSAFGSMIGFDTAGTLRTEVPVVAGWQVSANAPLVGFFSNTSGDVYLRSSTGQLVSWSSTNGLRHHSMP